MRKAIALAFLLALGLLASLAFGPYVPNAEASCGLSCRYGQLD